jgi:CDP-diacylglycerol--glycerol-3-phosphate 3-phosphatidyltransferase
METVSSPAVAEPVRSGVGVTAIPNLLSLFRIGLVPVLVVLLAWGSLATRLTAAACFLVACITDFLDGWLARRHGITSALGQYLDPLADKLLVAAVMIMLAAIGPEQGVPAWMAVVIILREFAVTGLRGIASRGGVLLPAMELGKYKMIFEIFALQSLLVLVRFPIPGTGLVVDFHAAGMVFLWVALVLATWSAIDYHVRVLREVVIS